MRIYAINNSVDRQKQPSFNAKLLFNSRRINSDLKYAGTSLEQRKLIIRTLMDKRARYKRATKSKDVTAEVTTIRTDDNSTRMYVGYGDGTYVSFKVQGNGLPELPPENKETLIDILKDILLIRNVKRGF